MNAIEELIKEHEAVRLTLRILNRIGRQIDETGRIAHTEHVENLFDFFGTFVDRCHHGKEEALLFPALERVGISREGGPVGVMLHEHQQGRDLVGKMRAELSSYLNGDGKAARRFKLHADDYVQLLDYHIEKENKVLFPLATQHLSKQTLAEMKERFDRVESEQIGIGEHERFHQMIAALEKTYIEGVSCPCA